MIRSLRALLPSPHHSLIHRLPVSGTAKGKGKGKGKDKAAQPLKRSIIPKKKPSAAANTSARRTTNAASDLTRMAESCLSAPTPLPHLSARDRRREADRLALGLISKQRQRELDQAKSKASSPPEDEPFLMGTPGLDYISLGLVDAEKIPEYKLTVEDGRRLAKEYSRVLMRRHRERQAAESALLRLKKEAIAALPEGLRGAAMVPDFAPFPANRFMATLTPPIEGYVEKVKEAARKSVGKEKLR